MHVLFCRLGSKESNDDSYTSVLRDYCLFDSEMSVISVVWRDCYHLIDVYNDEQVLCIIGVFCSLGLLASSHLHNSPVCVCVCLSVSVCMPVCV